MFVLDLISITKNYIILIFDIKDKKNILMIEFQNAKGAKIMYQKY